MSPWAQERRSLVSLYDLPKHILPTHPLADHAIAAVGSPPIDIRSTR
jgi:hypothetical protein